MIFRKLMTISAVLMIAGGLAACRDDEQGRPLSYQKGEYGGTPDEPLTDEQRRQLQHRGSYQGF